MVTTPSRTERESPDSVLLVPESVESVLAQHDGASLIRLDQYSSTGVECGLELRGE